MANKSEITIKLDVETMRRVAFIKKKTGLVNTSEVVRLAIKANHDHLKEE